jgi:toxin ParE1/3/4
VNWQVTIRPAAHADLREARDWYDRRREGLGNEFLLAVADAMLALEETPQRQPIYYRDFRRVLTSILTGASPSFAGSPCCVPW